MPPKTPAIRFQRKSKTYLVYGPFELTKQPSGQGKASDGWLVWFEGRTIAQASHLNAAKAWVKRETLKLLDAPADMP